jgi:hypothetical protein
MRLSFLRVREPATSAPLGQDPLRLGEASFPIESVTSQIPYDAAGSAGEDGQGGAGAPTRMDQVAYELSGSASAWREVAAASGIDDPTVVPAGTQFKLPRVDGKEAAR